MKRIALSLLLCTSAFTEQVDSEVSYVQKNRKNSQVETPFYQGDEALPARFPAAYNAPAGVQLMKEDSKIPDFYIDLAFIYYYAEQGGLNLANSGQIITPSGSTNLVTSSIANGTVLNHDFEYTPGFKIGLGSNCDEWNVDAKYTWIRQTTNTSQSAPAPESAVAGGGAWITNNWFEQANAISGQGLAGTDISSEWKLSMDIADLTTGRPYYQGQTLTVSPFFGLRYASIRQYYNVTLQTTPLLTTLPSTSVTSENNSNSWGIGPRVGFGADCLLGGGFRLEGNAAFTALYTAFTHVNHEENLASTTSTVGVTQGNYQTVRPELELGVALGWGMYLAKQRLHFDFSAGYDFAVFWEQNMIRQVMDETITGVSGGANSLTLQGLNLSARFDF